MQWTKLTDLTEKPLRYSLEPDARRNPVHRRLVPRESYKVLLDVNENGQRCWRPPSDGVTQVGLRIGRDGGTGLQDRRRRAVPSISGHQRPASLCVLPP